MNEKLVNNSFPIEVFNPKLQDIANDYVRMYESNINAVCGVMLTTMAFPLNNYYEIKITANHIVRPNLWFMYIAYPSTGKSPLINTIIKSIRVKDQDLMKAYNKNMSLFIEYSKLKKEFKSEPQLLTEWVDNNCQGIVPTEPRKLNILLHQSTTEALNKAMNVKENDGRSIMYFVDEILGIYNSFGKYSGGKSSGEEEFNRLFNYDGENISRVSGDVNVSEKNISIIATTQPDISYDVISKQRIGNGNAFRWLYFMDEQLNLSKNNIRSTMDIDNEYNPLSEFNAMISNYLQDYNLDINNRIELKLSRECREIVADCIDDWNNKARFNEYDIDAKTFQSITGKMQDYIFKFAIVLNRTNQYFNRLSPSIDITTTDINSAVKLANYYILNSIKVLNKVMDSSSKFFKSSEEQQFYENLPDTFISGDFDNLYISKQLGVLRSAQRLRKKWSSKDFKLIAKNAKNQYYKLPI